MYPLSPACRKKLNSFKEAYYKTLQYHQNNGNFYEAITQLNLEKGLIFLLQ